MAEMKSPSVAGAERKPAWDGLWNIDDSGAYLAATRCAKCGGAALGVREVCPHCLAQGEALSADRIGRRGRLYTATVIHQAPAGFETPFRVGYVDVEDGVRIFAHIEHGDGAPAIGEEVDLSIAAVKADADGTPLDGPFYHHIDGGQV